MGRPVFLVENFFSPVMFPAHTIAASSESPGHEAWRVGTARRSTRNRWVPATGQENTDAWVSVQCDALRLADMFVLERGHNLQGTRIRIEASNDNFATKVTVFDATLPSGVSAPANLGAVPGATTEEGAWLYRASAPIAARYWRLYVPAMGAGLKPEVVGLWVGLSYRPSFLLDLPFDWGQRELAYEVVLSDTLWAGVSRPAQRRTGDITLSLSDHEEYDVARYHIEELFLRGHPMWIIFDEARAERSVLALAPPGTAGFRIERGWAYMRGTFSWFEHEPLQVR